MKTGFDQGIMPRRPGRVRARTSTTYVVMLTLVAACAPPLDTDRPTFPFAGRWTASIPKASPPLIDNVAWWQSYRDASLDRLVSLALTDSATLAAARARSAAADAAAGAVPGALTLSGGVGATGQVPLGRGASTTTTEADFGVLLLLDPGRSRAAERAAAGARAAQAAAEEQAARLLLIARVTETYIELRLAQTLLALAEAESARQRQTRALAKQLEGAGEGTRLDTVRTDARMATLSASLPSLRATVSARLAELAVLAGHAPGSLPADIATALAARGPQPRSTLAPNLGIPADLIRNRPDIRAAEAGYDAARAELGQARATLWPRLTLSGMVEVGSARTGDMTLGPALRLPVIPNTTTRAKITSQEARVRAAHSDWREAVLGALLEVETALLDYRAAVATETATEHAARLYREALALTRELVDSEQAALSDLFEAEDLLARAEEARATAHAARALGFARLNLRLGAGTSPLQE